MDPAPEDDFLTLPETMAIYRFRSERAARAFMRAAGGAVVGGKLLLRRRDGRRYFDRLAAEAMAGRDARCASSRSGDHPRRGRPSAAPVFVRAP